MHPHLRHPFFFLIVLLQTQLTVGFTSKSPSFTPSSSIPSPVTTNMIRTKKDQYPECCHQLISECCPETFENDITLSQHTSTTLQQTRCGGSTSNGGDSTQLSSSSPDTSSSVTPPLSKQMLAEFIGTFIIVQIGCGTVCSAIYKGAQTGLWQIAAVWSIAVTLAISTTAAISDAHLNPAITIAFTLLRGFSPIKVIPYILSQLGGAIAAAAMNYALFSDSISAFEKANDIVRGTLSSISSASAFGEYWSVSTWSTAFLAEAYGTAVLAFVIFALTNPKNKTTSDHSFMVPPLIGVTVGALISVIAPLTQAGFNPARDFGPRIVALVCGWKSIAMKGWWVYVVAPIVGAPIGAYMADKILYSDEKNSK